MLPPPYDLLQPLYLPLSSQAQPTKIGDRIFLPVHTDLPQIYIFPYHCLLTLNLHVLPLISLIDRIRLNFLYTETQGEIGRFVILPKTAVVEIVFLHPALRPTRLHPNVDVADLQIDIVQYSDQHFLQKTPLAGSLPHLL